MVRRPQQEVAWRVRPLQIAREGHADNRRESTAVERVALDDDDRSAEARA